MMDMDYETIRAEAKAAETRAIRTEKLKYLSISCCGSWRCSFNW